MDNLKFTFPFKSDARQFNALALYDPIGSALRYWIGTDCAGTKTWRPI